MAVRCLRCGRLLFNVKEHRQIEIKCPKCGYINKISLDNAGKFSYIESDIIGIGGFEPRP